MSALPVVVLVGRPNAGKSSLYNRVTGGHAKVGNFPGITVDVLEATVTHGASTVRVIDLPGLYSVAAASDAESDEGVARRFLDELRAEGSPVVLVQVMDATCPASGLRLTRELRALGLPMVLAATQRDVLDAQGRELDVKALREALGVDVLSVSAKEEGAKKAVLDAALRALDAGVAPSGARFDPDALGRAVLHDKGVVSAKALKLRSRTERLDRWLLHPYVGPALFVGLMVGLFSAVFLVADPATAAVDWMVRGLSGVVARRVGDGLLRSFIVDGVLGGAGTVLVFLPQIVVLTVAMELLDASGYLARGVFLVDRSLRAVGLGGRAFVPMLTGHACAIPAIAATRIIRNPRERLTAILVIPLMTCSARIPTYALLLSAFFARSVWLRAGVFVGLYAAGVASGLIASAVLRRTVTRGRVLPLVLEMPAYHAPEARAVARTALRAALRFLKDVGTTILIASAVLWALLNVPMPRALDRGADTREVPVAVARMQHSVGAGLGRALEPVTRIAGFDWRINVGLLGSFGARELMVGTLGVITGLEEVDDEHSEALAVRLRELRAPDGTHAYGMATGLALMAFFVIACQCLSTVAAIRRETRSWGWALFTLGWTYAVGFALAVVVYQVARLLGG